MLPILVLKSLDDLDVVELESVSIEKLGCCQDLPCESVHVLTNALDIIRMAVFIHDHLVMQQLVFPMHPRIWIIYRVVQGNDELNH